MRDRATMNAMRSGLVVVGAIAFGYLTLQLGVRPFLERAQRTLDLQLESEQQNQNKNQDHLSQQQSSFDDSRDSASESS